MAETLLVIIFLGVLVGIVYYIFTKNKNKAAQVLPFEPDAEKREQQRKEVDIRDKSIQEALDKYADRKKAYLEAKEKIKNESNTNPPADVLVINRNSKPTNNGSSNNPA
jgi:cbb3-type cytochrome oxidase subunit 3